MMELMEGYVEEGANIGLSNPNHWSPEAVDFLGMTTSATSANGLLSVLSYDLTFPNAAADVGIAPFPTRLQQEQAEGACSTGDDVDEAGLRIS